MAVNPQQKGKEMKLLAKIWDMIAYPINTLRILHEESRTGGIDGTDTWTGGEHR